MSTVLVLPVIALAAARRFVVTFCIAALVVPAAFAQQAAGDAVLLREIQADVAAGRWAEASARAESAAQRLTGQAEFHQLRAAVFLKTGELVRAAEEANRAVGLDPRQTRYYLLRGRIYERAGNPAAAQADYRRALELDPRNTASVLLLSNLLLQAERPSDAASVVMQALRRIPASGALRFELGRIDEIQGRPKNALSQYARAVRLDPKLAAAHGALGRLYRDQPGMLARSARHLQTAVRLQPRQANWHYELGLTYKQQQLLANAQAELEKAAELDGDEPRIYSALSEVYRLRQMDQEAGQMRRRFSTLAQTSEQEKLRRARLDSEFQRAQQLEFAGRIAPALAAYQRILASSPDEPQVHFALARLRLSQNQPDRAEEHIVEAIQMRSQNPDYHHFYAALLFDLKRHTEAEREVRAALLLRPADSGLQNLLGNVLLASGQVEGAIAAYQRAAEISPNESVYRLNLASAYRLKGDAPAADRELELYRKLLASQGRPR